MDLTALFLHVALFGAEWVMWLLLALSVVSVTIITERAIFFWTRRVNFPHLASELARLLRAGDVNTALKTVRNSKAIECIVVAAGLAESHRGLQATSEAMLSAKVRERLRLESWLAVLGTLGNNSPFIGLLGTVLGIIKASHDLSAAQAAGQAAASAVMSGIFEALVATAIGLFVAIPAVMAFNFFQRRVRIRSLNTDSVAHLVLSMFKTGQTAEASSRTPRSGEVSRPPKSGEVSRPQKPAEVSRPQKSGEV